MPQWKVQTKIDSKKVIIRILEDTQNRLKLRILIFEGTQTDSKKVRMLTLESQTEGKDATMEGTKTDSKKVRILTLEGRQNRLKVRMLVLEGT